MAEDTPATPASKKGSVPLYARVMAKDRLAIPESVLADFPGTEHFRVRCEDGRIILTPVQVSAGDAVRSKLKSMGITEQDVADAVAWARGR